MHSRPLLDYLAFPEDAPDALSNSARDSLDPLAARLKDLEARLAANSAAASAPSQDLTLSAQVEAILKRKAGLQPASNPHAAAPDLSVERPFAPTRIAVEPPPSVPATDVGTAADQDFLKFAEAVYLIGQAAKRFIDQPEAQIPHRPATKAEIASAGEAEALSAVLRETVSAFRSVADDLAVSAAEIRHFAEREERPPQRRRTQSSQYRHDDEIIELRESIADLQDRLDDLLHARRSRRY